MTPERPDPKDLHEERFPAVASEVHCRICSRPMCLDRYDRWVHIYSGECTHPQPVRREVRA